MKNKLTYSLNYRKPKDQYSDNDELMVCIRYYHKDHKDSKAKIIKKSTGVKCKLADWDKDWQAGCASPAEMFKWSGEAASSGWNEVLDRASKQPGANVTKNRDYSF